MHTMQMNLASQSVLEGLNACLDHRGEVRTGNKHEQLYVRRCHCIKPEAEDIAASNVCMHVVHTLHPQ